MDTNSAPHDPAQAATANKHDFYEWLDMTIKAITLFFGLLAVFQALVAYRQDIAEKIIDQRIQAFDGALTAGGEVVLGKDWDTIGSALDRFGVVTHGQVLAAIGEGPAYDAMTDFYNVGVKIWNGTTYDDPIDHDKLETAFEDMSKTFGDVVNVPQSSRLALVAPAKK
jgi:hypothetical protein